MLFGEEIYSSRKKAQEMPQIVYHYCSLESFLAIVEHSSIRLSSITKLNDSSEVTNVIPILKDVIFKVLNDYSNCLLTSFQFDSSIIANIVDSFFDDISKNFYIACFSEKRDLLSQWDRYADNAKGVAIGFNTQYFVRLQVESETNFIFSKIIYDNNILRTAVEKFLRSQIQKNFNEKSVENTIDVIGNAIINLILTVLKYSVLFKNPFFAEESEWRLVYNPLGRIRQLEDMSAYHDRLLEVNQYNQVQSGFQKGEYGFRVIDGNKISSFIDLKFDLIKQGLIQEIILGPKSVMQYTDKDLLLLLAAHGYKISHIKFNGKLVLLKSNIPFC